LAQFLSLQIYRYYIDITVLKPMRKIEKDRKKRHVRKVEHAPRWLICCEGKSEVVYLTALINELAQKSQAEGKVRHNINLGVPSSRCAVKTLCGACGRQHKELYNKIVLCARASQFERVWMLFDLDADCDLENKRRLINDFKDTIKQCEVDSIVTPIWSVPCFEYWLALHSGSRIDVGSIETLTAKIRQKVGTSIRDKMICDKMYSSMPKENHCSVKKPVICEKALSKPYYNSFRALGGEQGSTLAEKMCEQVYKEYNPRAVAESSLDFSKISCCSNMHILIHALHKYFDDLPRC